MPALLLHRPSDVATILDVSISTVRRLVSRGHLEAVYVGAATRITDRSVQAVAQTGTRRAKPKGKR